MTHVAATADAAAALIAVMMAILPSLYELQNVMLILCCFLLLSTYVSMYGMGTYVASFWGTWLAHGAELTMTLTLLCIYHGAVSCRAFWRARNILQLIFRTITS